MTTHLVPMHDGITLGILAGGQASRLGGRDKAWLERDGVPLVVGLAEGLAAHVDAVIVSANRNPERYLSHGLRVVHDRVAGIGPLGGLDALAAACRSEWLLTLPVDLLRHPAGLVDALKREPAGAWAEDDDGSQPLVALWRRDLLRGGAGSAIANGELAVHALQARLGMARVRFHDTRFGNLNTPEALAAAGVA